MGATEEESVGGSNRNQPSSSMEIQLRKVVWQGGGSHRGSRFWELCNPLEARETSEGEPWPLVEFGKRGCWSSVKYPLSCVRLTLGNHLINRYNSLSYAPTFRTRAFREPG